MKNYHLLKKKGHYSGNYRLDINDCEEPKSDTEETKQKWLDRERKIRIKRKLKRWRNNISPTIQPKKLTVHMVGQSHIDMAWMWRSEQTRQKAQVTFKKAILHSELFPNSFCFALSQPILLEWIQADNPTLFKSIQKKVKKGNIELVGGSYIEPDAMMPSGEAMIRQRLYGMRFYRNYFNQLPKVEWFLDSFGFNYGLPQILVKSGAKYFWTSKMTWNRDTIFPFVHFWWHSPDGSKLVAANFHYDPQVLETWEEYKVGRYLLKDDATRIWNYNLDYSKLKDHIKKDEICPHVGFFFGQSDGGHGPTHKEVAEANKLAKLNWFQWSSVEKFFNALEQYSKHFPIWNDELYLEFHRGVFSNHAEVKRYNRKFENLLTSLESLMVFIDFYFPEYEYPKKDLEDLWKTTLKNQFHDILPGSSIPEVYDDCWEDWKSQERIIDKHINHIGNILSKKSKDLPDPSTAEFLIYNPLSWERNSRVFIPITVFQEKTELSDKEKTPYAKLILNNKADDEYICQPISADPEEAIDPLPAGWWTVLTLAPISIQKARIKLLDKKEQNAIKNRKKIENIQISQNSLSNDIIEIKINEETGSIISLFGKNINEEQNLLNGEESNLTFCYRDRVPIQYHAWNLTPEYWNHQLPFSNEKNVRISIAEQGPIFSILKIRKSIGPSTVTQKISLFKECSEVFLEYLSDWNQKDAMVKIKYTPNTNSTEVIADEMSCAISSKIHPETPCDAARFEKICHKYFDLSTADRKWGIAILNEGKYAFDVTDGKISLTLLRACRYPESAPEAWVNKERELNEGKYGHKVPKYSGIGPFSCRYALFPHKGGALQNSDGSPNIIVKKKAEEFNKPNLIIPIGANSALIDDIPNNDPLFSISPKNVMLSALKYNEWDKNNDIIIRLQEYSGYSCKVLLKFKKTFARNISKIKAVDLIEREEERDFLWDNVNGELSFTMGKFELSTFKLEISQ